MAKRRDLLKDYNTKSVQALVKGVTESRKRLIELNQEKILGKLKNVGEIKQVRRQIALQMTLINQKSAETAASGEKK